MRYQRQSSLYATTGMPSPLKRSGFSLIELMVALAILAAVTTIALRSVTKLQDQARYTNTTSTLNNVQSAIIGPANQHWPDGSPQVTGFVADIGRLPNYLISTTPADPLGLNGDPLTELLQKPSSVPAFHYLSANTDASVVIGTGWQGPYLRLGAGPAFIRDGWGNSFLAYDNSGNPATTGNPIYQLASDGSNAAPYNTPVSVPSPTIVSGGGFVSTATLSGRITMNVATDLAGSNTGNQSGPLPNATYAGIPVSIWVCYYGPDTTASPNPVGDVPLQVTDIVNWRYVLTSNSSVSTAADGSGNVTIGPRVIKAYVVNSSMVTSVATFRSNANSTPGSAGPVYAVATLNVTAAGGAQAVPDLVLPHYSP